VKVVVVDTPNVDAPKITFFFVSRNMAINFINFDTITQPKGNYNAHVFISKIK